MVRIEAKIQNHFRLPPPAPYQGSRAFALVSLRIALAHTGKNISTLSGRHYEAAITQQANTRKSAWYWMAWSCHDTKEVSGYE